LIVCIGSDAHRRATPQRFEAGASAAAKALKVSWWDPEDLAFRSTTVEGWLNSDEHLQSTLVIVGGGGRGKSKLAHMLATELTLGQGSEQYIFTKALDPLGMLSHTGQIRKSGAVVFTDFEMKSGRSGGGDLLGPEAMKSLLDIVEGGTIVGTRYRPTTFRPFLPRVLALRGSEEEYGRWFSENGHSSLAAMLTSLKDEAAATRELRAADAHAQAIARRMAVALVPDAGSLITEETKRSLAVDTRAMAAAALARRKAAQL
jgi:hypothetical protein